MCWEIEKVIQVSIPWRKHSSSWPRNKITVTRTQGNWRVNNTAQKHKKILKTQLISKKKKKKSKEKLYIGKIKKDYHRESMAYRLMMVPLKLINIVIYKKSTKIYAQRLSNSTLFLSTRSEVVEFNIFQNHYISHKYNVHHSIHNEEIHHWSWNINMIS